MDTDKLVEYDDVKSIIYGKNNRGKVVRSEFSYYILNHLFLWDRCVASGVLH